MNDLRDKAEKALNRVRLFDDSKEVALGVNEIDDYWAREACVQIEGLWKLIKQMRQLLANAIKHMNHLEAELANAQRKPLTDEDIEVAAKSVPAAVYELMYGHEITVEKFRAALAEFARAIERAHGIGEQQ